MNAMMRPVEHEGRQLTAANVREHVNLIQQVMKAVMQEGTHYGVIPGCKQPSLYKAGSEVLLTTFRIAVSVVVEDLSTADCIRYRVRTIGTHQTTGIVVGEGVGECSSDEAKYKWRRCYAKQEFDATPESRRRIKYGSSNGKTWENMEVRTEPADQANTILKMAKKRAQIDLTLTALAASDCFTQDVEDLPEETIREQVERAHETEMRKPENGGKPLSGAWDRMDEKTKATMVDQAQSLHEMVDSGDAEGAFDLLETFGYDNDHIAALWTRLPSEDRSAIRKVRDKRNAAKEKAQ